MATLQNKCENLGFVERVKMYSQKITLIILCYNNLGLLTLLKLLFFQCELQHSTSIILK